MDGVSFKIDGSAGRAGRGCDFIIFKRPPRERRRLIGIRIEIPLAVLGFSWSGTIDWHINDIYARGLGWQGKMF